MSLNPSNGIAARTNPDKTMFHNLAHRLKEWDNDLQKEVDIPNKEAVCAAADDAVRAELTLAGIIDETMADKIAAGGNYIDHDHRCYAEMGLRGGEVPTSIFASAYGWTFDRLWYYYSAKGPGIPPDVAERFHKVWGTQVRVDGHCGCPSPIEWHHGFGVGSYHIDTQEGLNAFVKLLASIYIPGKPDEDK